MLRSQAAQFPVVSDALAPQAGVPARIAQALAMSVVAALCAQIEVPLPFTPVPLTGQTAAVLFAGALLGSRWGAASMALYLLEGSAGLPVFAGGGAGFLHLAGPTGGYLLSFPLAAWATGRLAERGWGRSFWSAALMMLLGSVILFSVGLLGLARFVPADRLLALGLWPFVPGDLVKIGLSASALPLGWRLIGRRR
ncbi:MAG TPA: biotin transporter BioY [Elusimicrobia bacterium]|nr:biotin transporter BioY [Elusimicrobiota bacterium]